METLMGSAQCFMTPTVTTDFRRAAVRIYDWLKYGHKKTPKEQANGVQTIGSVHVFLIC